MDASKPGPRWAVLVSRARVPLAALAILLVVAEWVLPVALPRFTGLAVALVALALYFRGGRVHAEPTTLAAPFEGRWVPVNSPADKVPSHGVHAYGQTYAIDLVHKPAGEWKLELHWGGPHTRPAEDYPGFGVPVLAPADGVVVRVRNNARDHRARTSWLGLGLMTLEGGAMEVTGRILGNHVVLDIGDGRYVALAHLRRGSVTVRPGDRLRAGEQLGECGNSGNSSEPHLHIQVMDSPSILRAAGLPLRFEGLQTEGGDPIEVPPNGHPVHATAS